jgi:NAD(P)-dependent dehydrogenase (short-subunit alcohol dehydrogenase family)
MSRTISSPVVVVTGAARGIGAATVTELVRRGARVLAADADPTVERVAADAPGNVIARKVDVRDGAAVKTVIDEAVTQFGRLDAVFNNAGIFGVSAPVSDYPDDIFQRVLEVNLWGVYFGMKHAIPHLRESGGGAIVNTASTGALAAAPNNGPYVASKHAVLGLTRAAALELAKEEIRVIALCPGATDTPMLKEVIEGWSAKAPEEVQAVMETITPTGRMGRPEEIAQVAAWLLLEAPAYLTGAPIPVDGALTAQ